MKKGQGRSRETRQRYRQVMEVARTIMKAKDVVKSEILYIFGR